MNNTNELVYDGRESQRHCAAQCCLLGSIAAAQHLVKAGAGVDAKDGPHLRAVFQELGLAA